MDVSFAVFANVSAYKLLCEKKQINYCHRQLSLVVMEFVTRRTIFPCDCGTSCYGSSYNSPRCYGSMGENRAYSTPPSQSLLDQLMSIREQQNHARFARLAQRFVGCILARRDSPRPEVYAATSEFFTGLMGIFNANHPPSISLLAYTERLLQYGVSEESLVLTLIYIDRLLKAHPSFSLTEINTHRLILACTVVGLKHWEDSFSSNEFFARVGCVTVEDMRDLEVAVLCLLDFKLHVSTEGFATYQRSVVPAPAVCVSVTSSASPHTSTCPDHVNTTSTSLPLWSAISYNAPLTNSPPSLSPPNCSQTPVRAGSPPYSSQASFYSSLSSSPTSTTIPSTSPSAHHTHTPSHTHTHAHAHHPRRNHSTSPRHHADNGRSEYNTECSHSHSHTHSHDHSHSHHSFDRHHQHAHRHAEQSSAALIDATVGSLAELVGQALQTLTMNNFNTSRSALTGLTSTNASL